MELMTIQAIFGISFSMVSFIWSASSHIRNARAAVLEKDVMFRNVVIFDQGEGGNQEKSIKFKLKNAYDFIQNYENIRGIDSKDSNIFNTATLLIILSILLIFVRLGKDILGSSYNAINIAFSSIHFIVIVIIIFISISTIRLLNKISRKIEV